MNGIDFLDKGWRLGPKRPCMIDAATGRSYTYQWVRRQTLRVANALRIRGYGKGCKASVLSHNSAESFAVVLSVFRAAVSYIPVNARNTARQNAEILKAFDCEILFVQQALLPQLETFRAVAPAIREFVCVDGSAPGCPHLEEWLGDAGEEEHVLPHEPEGIMEVLPTSATTGFPKGVLWSNRQMESVVANFTAVAPAPVPPVFLAVAPLTHLSGKFMQYVMAHGGTGVILANADKRRILECIPQYRISHLFLPPTVIYDLLQEPGVRDVDFSSLRYFLYSAAPMSPEKLKQALEVFGPVMCQVWGQSEAAWNTIMLPADHYVDGRVADTRRLSSCGRPLPYVKVGVMDDQGGLLPAGETGELVVQGLCVMLGYYGNPEETAEVSKFGWHHTGDLGYEDEDGFFHIVDRKRDMIISGGFNIYSVEVERGVMAHPAVQECVAIGVPHDRWGEEVKVVAELKPGASVTPGELVAFARDQLGAMKAPKTVDIVDQLPRSPIGKVLKREVRKRFWVGRDRMVA